MRIFQYSLLLLPFCILFCPTQNTFAIGDRAVYVEVQNEYQNSVLQRAGKEIDQPRRKLKVDFSTVEIPDSTAEFNQVWHFAPTCQDLTGSCWSFSSVSFMESEIYRLSGRKIKLSVMYMTYWEYVEKARRFVHQKGDSRFSRGSQANATPRIMRQHGLVPQSAYPGFCPGEDFYNDTRMFDEMRSYLKKMEQNASWNETEAISTIRSILDRYIGPPPETVEIAGKMVSPVQFMKQVAQLNPDDYVDAISLMQQPFGKQVEYPVPDNWWHSDTYWNLPLNDFMAVIRNAIQKGYSVGIVGDNSEPGFFPPLDVAMIPTFDIPADQINDAARQYRFTEGNTTDDHAIHLVGWMNKNGTNWYLIKDSSTRAQNGRFPGYMFYREDFIRLKIMNILVHRDMMKEFLEKYSH